MKKTLLIIFLLITSINLYGQSETQVLEQLKSKYASVTDMHAKMEIQRSGLPAEQMEVWFDSNRSRMVSSDVEMMLNDTHFIVVDKQGQQINVQPRTSTGQTAQNYKLPIDSLLENNNGVVVDTLSDQSIIQVTAQLSHPVITEMTLKMDMSLNLTEASYVMNSMTGGQAVMQVRYLEFDINPDWSLGQFGLDNYMLQQGDSLQPAPAFSAYSVNEISTIYSK
ncbi:MAG: hypothetical protein AAFO69_01675 [Bacteroidota bacterium]